MSASLTYQESGTVPRDETHIVFAQTMGYVAATAAFFAAGAYLGRDLAYGAGIVAFIAAFGVLIGIRFAARKSQSLAVGLLGLFGVLIGLALARYVLRLEPLASADQAAVVAAVAPNLQRYLTGPLDARSAP